MSWLLNLYETYKGNESRVGEPEVKYNGQEFTLLPISHTTQNAHIEVQITEDGEFHSATVIEKKDASTLIPCTENAANRAGKTVAPYPLHDKLKYVAGDFVTYSGKTEEAESYSKYIAELKEWADSPEATSKVKSIYAYVKQGRLIQDLVAERILYVDTNGKLIDTWDKKYEPLHGEKPPIFSVVAGEQESAFIRFTVYSPHTVLTKVWKDPDMYQSFIGFYDKKLGNTDLCYVTGEHMPSTDKHANKIRNAGDKAKLISANDDRGFTFRGRFQESKEVASIGYDVSQKAHNALKWLINRQGKIVDQRVFLVWGNDILSIPVPSEDTYSLYDELDEEEKMTSTEEQFAAELAKALDGYRNDLTSKAKVTILVIDSATTGRLSVQYYRNIDKDLYLDRLRDWHSSCMWLHRYQKNTDGEKVHFYGAPATKDIAYAAYGLKVNEKIVKGLMERILPCIVDQRSIPTDIVKSAFYRASNPVSMDKWEWEKTLSITCALINRKVGYKVALDLENKDRSYLFGRLLAVADVLERRALGAEENRASNAIRYMNSFSKYPARTWKTIQSALQPYQSKLGMKGRYLSSLIDEIASTMSFEEFNNKPLSEKYLLGFYSQRHELYKKKEEVASAEHN